MTVDGKTIARAEAAAFGGTQRVHQYTADSYDLTVNILSAVDGPHAGITSYGTVDLSTVDNGLETEDGTPVRVEILSAAPSEIEEFSYVLMASAINVATGESSIAPGMIHPDTVSLYLPDVTMKHTLFVTPFLWDDTTLAPLRDDDAIVLFLQGVPISDAEFAYAREHGSDALETLFEEAQIDVFDLNRPSVV